METSDFRLESIGSLEAAEALSRRARTVIPAYRHWVNSLGLLDAEFVRLPVVDKVGYLSGYDYADLLGDDAERAFTVFRSSGSSGRAFYWPQLKDGQTEGLVAWRSYLERVFSIHKKKTLAIVGLALGSWIGGDQFSWGLKSIASTTPYPFTVFSPGNHHDEILDIADKASRFVDQILLFVCPSAIGHLLLRAEQEGRALPIKKLRYIVLGEPFPESLRTSLAGKSQCLPSEQILFSIYGSADTGTLGIESPASVALRKLLCGNSTLATSLGVTGVVPLFFHHSAPDAYLESLHGELCVTRWQGIPLIRYNLHDAVELWSWRRIRDSVLSSPLLAKEDQTWVAFLEAAGDLPDILAVAGRSDASLILCGTNLTESMLDEAVRTPELESKLTGIYHARILLEGERQFLQFDLELRQGIPADPTVVDELYATLIRSLGRAQPEFQADWENVYRIWDKDRQRRILRLNPVHWPQLSKKTETGAKLRGLQK